MSASDWTGPDRWEIIPGTINTTQCPAGDMANNDMLTVTGVGGASGDKLDRKHSGSTVSPTWGTNCKINASNTAILDFTHHSIGSCHLRHTAGAGGAPAQIEFFKGEYVEPKEEEGPPTGGVWTAEDQT
jgi:hypothetical protein